MDSFANGRNWQQLTTHFAEKHNLIHDPGVTALDVMSELGEVAKTLLKASAYGTQPPQYGTDVAEELGDLLYSVCCLATAVGVDLDDALRQTLNKYEARWGATGQIGSAPHSQN